MNPNETPLGVLAFLALFAAAVAVAHYGPTAELTPTGGVVEWPAGFFDQGPDEAHQLLIAAAERQRSRKV